MFDKQKSKKQDSTDMRGTGAFNEAAGAQGNASGSFNSSSSTVAGKAAVIGPGIIIDGDISGTENLVIEGKVSGNVNLSAHEVTVGKTGEVNADVKARIIRISGKVKGDLSGEEKVIIASSGNVRGNIVAPRMMLEDGAIFKGSIDMDPGEAVNVKPAVAKAPATSVSGSAPSGSSQELGKDSLKKTPDLALKSG